MFYREAGQFKTSYAADMAIFPIRQDRIGLGADSARRLRRHSARRRRFLAQHDDDPVPDLVAGRDRAQYSDRLYRAAVARHRRPSWGSAPTPATSSTTYFPQREHPRLDRRLRIRLQRGRRVVRPAEPAHQGLLSRGGDAGRAVLPRMVLRPRALALQLQRRPARSRSPTQTLFGVPVTGPERDAGDALSGRR